jgi:hypothetical protein
MDVSQQQISYGDPYVDASGSILKTNLNSVFMNVPFKGNQRFLETVLIAISLPYFKNATPFSSRVHLFFGW